MQHQGIVPTDLHTSGLLFQLNELRLCFLLVFVENYYVVVLTLRLCDLLADMGLHCS